MLLGCSVGFCLPSPPCANPPSRPHCLGNALQSPHKGKLRWGGWSCPKPGEGFHGNADITGLGWLQSQALNGGAWVFTLQLPGGREPRALLGWVGLPETEVRHPALPLTCQLTLEQTIGPVRNSVSSPIKQN